MSIGDADRKTERCKNNSVDEFLGIVKTGRFMGGPKSDWIMQVGAEWRLEADLLLLSSEESFPTSNIAEWCRFRGGSGLQLRTRVCGAEISYVLSRLC
jgi:hypothetical protein